MQNLHIICYVKLFSYNVSPNRKQVVDLQKALQLRSSEHALKRNSLKWHVKIKTEAHALLWMNDEALDISSINTVFKRQSILSSFRYM